MTFIDIDQNTDEWLILRCGKVTGSGVAKVMANDGAAFGQPAKDYAVQIALERLTGIPQGSNYSNAHMERGHEEEPLARVAYEDEFFCDVDNGGFFDCGDTGCSPDGLVGENGLIEIKSHIFSTHYKNVKRADIDPSYKWQMYFNLQKTQRDWLDYLSYCQTYPAGNKLFVCRIMADKCEEAFSRMDSRLIKFEELIKEASANVKRQQGRLISSVKLK